VAVAVVVNGELVGHGWPGMVKALEVMMGEGKGRGQDPDKTTGQERAAEVHARNEAKVKEQPDPPEPSQLPAEPSAEQLPADIPGEDEPDPETLPDKPPIEEPLPSDEEIEADELPGEEDVPEEDFLPPEEAAQDDTIDNEEAEEQPHQDLPEGTRAQDYED
jgi:hypothetical protein